MGPRSNRLRFPILVAESGIGSLVPLEIPRTGPRVPLACEGATLRISALFGDRWPIPPAPANSGSGTTPFIVRRIIDAPGEVYQSQPVVLPQRCPVDSACPRERPEAVDDGVLPPGGQPRSECHKGLLMDC